MSSMANTLYMRKLWHSLQQKLHIFFSFQNNCTSSLDSGTPQANNIPCQSCYGDVKAPNLNLAMNEKKLVHIWKHNHEIE
jgi:hypothetical protein